MTRPTRPTKCCSRCGEETPATLDYFYSAGRGYLSARCKSCANEASRAWKEKNRDWRRAYDRAAYQRRRRDPEFVGVLRERSRQAKRRKYGFRPREGRRGPAGGRLLPGEPFANWLRAQPESIEAIARRTGIEPRRLRSPLYGAMVKEDTVDRVLVEIGDLMIGDLYPEIL